LLPLVADDELVEVPDDCVFAPPLPPATPPEASVLSAPEAGVVELSLSVVGEEEPEAAAESVSLDVEPEPDPISSGQMLVELLGS
jgi:hypothetical protein